MQKGTQQRKGLPRYVVYGQENFSGRREKITLKWEIAWFTQKGICGYSIIHRSTLAGHVTAKTDEGQITQG